MRKALTILLIAVLAGCTSSPRPRPPQDSKKDPYSIKEIGKSKELGRRTLEEAKRNYGLAMDEEVLSLVREVGRDVVEAGGGIPSTYHFFVIREDKVNAFALPGGYIFLFDGLLKELDGVDGLAGVLAHEVGHVKRNHFYDRRIEITNMATLAAVILAGMAGVVGPAGTLAQAINITKQLSYSREHEREADFFAVRTLEKAGYSLEGMYNFFRTLSLQERTSPDLPPYLSTHPGVTERMSFVAMAMERQRGKGPSKGHGVDWGRIITILYAREPEGLPLLLKHLERLEGPLGKERRTYIKALYNLKKGMYREAIGIYRDLVAMDPENPIYHADLAEAYLKLEDYGPAEKEAREAIDIVERRHLKKMALPYAILGTIERIRGDLDGAIRDLKEAERISPERPSIHYQLALTYRDLKDAAREEYHLGLYLRYRFEPEQAFLHLKRALSLSREERLSSKIRRELEEILREGV